MTRTATSRTAMTSAATTSSGGSRLRVAARWMVTFFGFPLGGFLAELLVGPVDGIGAALIGGLLTGAVVGAAQW